MTGLSFCAASAVATAEFTLPLLRMIASSLAINLVHRKNNLEHPRPRGDGHRLYALIELHSSVNQAYHVDLPLRQRADRFAEGPAAAADDVDFIDHQWRKIQRLRRSDGALEHDRAARSGHLHRQLEAGR